MKDELLKANPIIGERIKKLRKEKGMTQEDLAAKLGYKSKTSVAHIENGRDIPRQMVATLAEILETNPAYLMGWGDDPTPLTNWDERTIEDKKAHLTQLVEAGDPSDTTRLLMGLPEKQKNKAPVIVPTRADAKDKYRDLTEEDYQLLDMFADFLVFRHDQSDTDGTEQG